MGQTTVLIAVIGFTVGMTFRMVVLLPFQALVLLASILFAVRLDVSGLHMVLIIVVALAVIQYGYCLGVVARATLVRGYRTGRFEKDEPLMW